MEINNREVKKIMKKIEKNILKHEQETICCEWALRSLLSFLAAKSEETE